MAIRLAERRERTREAVIATILALLCLLVVVLIAAAMFQDRLLLRSDAIGLLERMFLAVLGLTVVAVRSYVR